MGNTVESPVKYITDRVTDPDVAAIIEYSGYRNHTKELHDYLLGKGTYYLLHQDKYDRKFAELERRADKIRSDIMARRSLSREQFTEFRRSICTQLNEIIHVIEGPPFDVEKVDAMIAAIQK